MSKVLAELTFPYGNKEPGVSPDELVRLDSLAERAHMARKAWFQGEPNLVTPFALRGARIRVAQGGERKFILACKRIIYFQDPSNTGFGAKGGR